jgi:hypothetical protein
MEVSDSLKKNSSENIKIEEAYSYKASLAILMKNTK